jgi:hypothetical protein
MNAQNAIIAANSWNTPAERIARTNAQIAVNAAESRKKQAEQRVYELNQELIELNSREGRLKKISSLITTIKDETDTMHLDKNTLKSITKSLDLILYKPTTIASEKKKTSGELAWALWEEK